MTNLELLNEVIDNSGLKRLYIAECLGITKQAFWKKTSGFSEWSVTQIATLQKLIGFDDETLMKIFFGR